MEISTKKKRRGAAGDDLTRAAPAFSLYGETPASHDDDFVHIEEIAARSQRYDWRDRPPRPSRPVPDPRARRRRSRLPARRGCGTSAGPCALVVPPATVHAFRFTPGAVGHVLTFAESRFVHGAPERRALVGGDVRAARRFGARFGRSGRGAARAPDRGNRRRVSRARRGLDDGGRGLDRRRRGADRAAARRRSRGARRAAARPSSTVDSAPCWRPPTPSIGRSAGTPRRSASRRVGSTGRRAPSPASRLTRRPRIG